MINLKVFCPFERISTVLCTTLHARGVSSCTVTFDGYGSHTFNVKADRDVALGYTVEDRLKAMSSPQITGHVFIADISKTYGFTVFNDLIATTPPESGSKISNGTIHGRKVYYPEAAFTTASDRHVSGLRVTPDHKLPFILRPYYNYPRMLVEIDKTQRHIYMHGPDLRTCSGMPTFVYQYDDHTVPFGTLSDRNMLDLMNQQSEELTLEPEVRVSDMPQPVQSVILDYGIGTVPFVFGQAILAINGTPMSGTAVYEILAYLVARQLCNSSELNIPGIKVDGNTVVIPVELKDGHYRLQPAVDDAIQTLVFANQHVANVMSGYSADKDTVYISKGDKIARLSSTTSTQTCFAFALSFVGIIPYGFGVVEQLEFIKALIDKGYLRIENGYVEGINREKFTDETFYLNETHVMIKGATRTSVKSLVDVPENKPFVFGFYRDPTNRTADKYHYVVAMRVGDTVKCLYDPYRACHFNTDFDLTRYVDDKDTRYECYQSSIA